jgi:hypothetical protein
VVEAAEIGDATGADRHLGGAGLAVHGSSTISRRRSIPFSAARDEWQEVRRGLAAELANWMHETGDPLLEGPVHAPRFWRNLERLKAEGAPSSG